MKTSCGRTRVGTRGFSIIEILIAVLVLGLGLLGLAAVFPSVIEQQRRASDEVAGAAAAQAFIAQIENQVRTLGFINDGTDATITVANAAGASVFGAGNGGEYGNGAGFSYLWEVDWEWNGAMPDLLSDYEMDGGLRFGSYLNEGSFNRAEFPVASRLSPAPFSGTAPAYVWDAVARRDAQDRVQLAVFVRRIDTGIRGQERDGDRPGDALSRALTGVGLPGNTPSHFPVSFDYAMSTRRPTLDGRRNVGDIRYSRPLSLAADVALAGDMVQGVTVDEADEGRVIRVTDSAANDVAVDAEPADIRLFTQAGVRFVDNLGVVREVVGPYRNRQMQGGTDTSSTGAQFVEVRPAYSVFQSQRAMMYSVTNAADRRSRLRQVVFTPQRAVAVAVLTIEN